MRRLQLDGSVDVFDYTGDDLTPEKVDYEGVRNVAAWSARCLVPDTPKTELLIKL